MLKYRVLSAVIAAPLAVVLACLGGWWLTAPLCVLAAIGFDEFRDKARTKGIRVNRPLGLAVCIAMILVGHAYVAPPDALWHLSPERYGRVVMGLLFALVMGGLTCYVFRYHHDQTAPVTADVSATLLVTLYIGVTFSFFVLVRAYYSGAEPVAVPGCPWYPLQFGARLLLLLFLTTWATDTFAYFTGKNLGKRKFTPTSPNKTIEGCIGGFLGAVVVGLLAGVWLRLPLPLAVPAGVLVGVAGQFGDLAKSILKRDLGTKDFGDLIPGHGGVLDRLDSLMMNVPLVYFLAVVVM